MTYERNFIIVVVPFSKTSLAYLKTIFQCAAQNIKSFILRVLLREMPFIGQYVMEYFLLEIIV